MSAPPSPWTAPFDQFQAAARDMAVTVAVYRQTLLDQGVPELEAAELTRGWQQAWCEQAFRSPRPT